MTGDPDATGGGNDSTSTRRRVLSGAAKGVAGIGIGLGVGAGGIYTLGTQTDYVDMGRVRQVVEASSGVDLDAPEKTAAPSKPDDASSPGDTPWDADTVVVALDRSDNVSGRDYVDSGFRNAVEFWNDYVAANEPFDLTLSYESDASDPDIRFVEQNIVYCSGEYRSPATGTDDLVPYVCVETLREAPDSTPIEPSLSFCGGGPGTYELVVTHALGRLVGYDVWSEPVSVMTPKILFGPSHAADPAARSILGRPGNGGMYTGHFIERIEGGASTLRNADARTVENALRDIAADDVLDFVEGHTSDMDEWKSEVRDLGFPRYADAYDEVVLNDEIAFLEETAATMTDLAENKAGEEIVGSDELDAVVSRLETVAAWPETTETFDVQVHRAWADMVWSEWAEE